MLERLKPQNLIDPFATARDIPPKGFWSFTRWSLAGAWPVIIVAAFMATMGGLIEVYAAILLGNVIDATANPALTSPRDFFAQTGGLLALCVFVYIVARPLFFAAGTFFSALVIAPSTYPLILSRLHRHTIGQAVTFFDNDFAGRVAQKQMQTARALTDLIVEGINTVGFALASFVGSILMVAAINWRLGAVLAVWFVAYVIVLKLFLPHVQKLSFGRADARARVTGQIVDTISNIRTVKLFAHSGHEDRAALSAMSAYRDTNVAFGVINTYFRLALMVLSGFSPVMLVGTSLWLWSLGLASLGEIVAAGTVSIRIAQMTGWVSFAMMSMFTWAGEVQDGIHTLARAHTILDPETPIKPTAKTTGAAIKFDAVTHSYGRKTGGITSVDLDIAPGERIGVVGASGAGKSTLVSLMLRLYDPETGAITINGRDIRAMAQEDLRRQIAMVTQDTGLFNRSARDNIAYGRTDATEDEILAAAKAAQAHEFILGLRDPKGRTGYAAHLGENGVKLSGGQRQRIALARAILKDAPILVLDEATSALDSEVEAEIQDELQTVMAGKTVLAIAHRLSTIAAMDRIIVMDAGQIVEAGDHESLLASGGLYARFWSRQSGGFISTDALKADETTDTPS